MTRFTLNSIGRPLGSEPAVLLVLPLSLPVRCFVQPMTR